MKKCIICGKEEGDKTNWNDEILVYLEDYKLPHGTITLCQNPNCRQHVTFQINDEAFPLAWVTKDDLYEEGFNEHLLTKEEADNLTAADLIEIAKDGNELLFNGSFNEEFHATLNTSVEGWRKEKERILIETIPLKELPLLIEDLKYDSNKTFLELRLKEGK